MCVEKCTLKTHHWICDVQLPIPRFSKNRKTFQNMHLFQKVLLRSVLHLTLHHPSNLSNNMWGSWREYTLPGTKDTGLRMDKSTHSPSRRLNSITFYTVGFGSIILSIPSAVLSPFVSLRNTKSTLKSPLVKFCWLQEIYPRLKWRTTPKSQPF